jgi:hypothetical protein
MAIKKNNAYDLLAYRVDQLEEKDKIHEEFIEKIREEQNAIKIEVMRMATKIAVVGSLLGSIGTYMLQKFWK